MAFHGEYKCSDCGKIESRDLLTAKKVTIQEIGVRPKILRSRIIGWMCPACVAGDADWKREPYASPGMISTADQHYGRKQAWRETDAGRAIEKAARE